MAAFWPDRSTHTGMRLSGEAGGGGRTPNVTPDGKEAFIDFGGLVKKNVQEILTSHGKIERFCHSTFWVILLKCTFHDVAP